MTNQNYQFHTLFNMPKPVIGCIHLLPLPGSPRYDGNISRLYKTALEEMDLLVRNGVDGIIMENFRDTPFYPGRVPAETVAAMAGIGREIVNAMNLPLGINVLRNDAESSMAVAAATGARFIRVNVHIAAMITDQGIIHGKSHETLRLRHRLESDVLIFADLNVKHAVPITPRDPSIEIPDLTERGMADAVIVSGTRTGEGVDLEELKTAKSYSDKPVIIGSGTNLDNLGQLFEHADGFIVGSYFKSHGSADNVIEESRVRNFMSRVKSLRN